MNLKAPMGLKIIAGAKIAKGVALAGLSLGVFDLIHKDLTSVAMHFVQFLRISPENHYVELMLEKLGVIEPSTLRRVGTLSALYSSILLIEGLGLWFGAAWSEYMVVLSTGAFVPEECYATIQHFTWVKLTFLILNSAILVYVVRLVWTRHKLRRAPGEAAASPAG